MELEEGHPPVAGVESEDGAERVDGAVQDKAEDAGVRASKGQPLKKSLTKERETPPSQPATAALIL